MSESNHYFQFLFRQGFWTFLLDCFAKIFSTFLDFRKGTPVDKEVWNGNSGPKISVSKVYFPQNPPDFVNLNRTQCLGLDQRIDFIRTDCMALIGKGLLTSEMVTS